MSRDDSMDSWLEEFHNLNQNVDNIQMSLLSLLPLYVQFSNQKDTYYLPKYAHLTS